MTTMKCSNKECESTFDPDHDDARYSPLLEGWYCWGCYEAMTEGSSHVWFVMPTGEKETWTINEFEIVDDYGDEPYRDDSLGARISRGYHRTDAYRGHYETRINEWVEVMTGWTTQNWGDPVSDAKQMFNKWADNVIRNGEYVPCPIAIVADPTSNLFAIGVSVWVQAGNESVLADYLGEEIGILERSIR